MQQHGTTATTLHNCSAALSGVSTRRNAGTQTHMVTGTKAAVATKQLRRWLRDEKQSRRRGSNRHLRTAASAGITQYT
jgi:hypothetical protein